MRRNRMVFKLLIPLLGLLCISVANAKIVYVKTTGADANDGSSWDRAKRTISSAVSVAALGDEVRVAAGVYPGSLSISRGIALLGGYSGEGDTRDFSSYVTVVESNSNAWAVDVSGGEPVTVDGFTIRFCPGKSGIGIRCSSVPHRVTNNRLVAINHIAVSCEQASALIANNLIAANFTGIVCNSCSPRILNNTIVGNGDQGGIYYKGSSSTPLIVNNIIAFNTVGINRYSGAGTPTLNNNCVYGNSTANYYGVSPGVNDICVDPKLACKEFAEFHVQADSPCINTGDSTVSGPPPVDVDYQPRMQGGAIDIGADESNGDSWTCDYRVLHVSASGPPGGDGASWSTAYSTIQAAMDDVLANGPAEVWVSKGTYDGPVTFSTFAHVYGGFLGAETERNQRNGRANKTVIDGHGGNYVVYGSKLSTLDGFTIRNASVGIQCGHMSLISNNVIVSTWSTGIRAEISSARMAGNTILGAAQGIYLGKSASAVTGNMLIGNSTAVYVYSASPLIANNICAGNQAGLACYENSSPDIINCTMAENYTGVLSSSSSPTVTNCIVAHNIRGIFAEYSPALLLIRNDVYGNLTNYSGVTPGSQDIAADPVFASRELGNFHIQPGSPCQNAGLSSAPGMQPTDIDGQARIQDGSIDLGADESDGATWSPVVRLIYVNAFNPASGNGSSWDSAYSTLAEALEDAALDWGTEIWVAKGAYAGNVRIPPFTGIYGGFSGSEARRDERNWQANIAVIEGGKSINTVKAGTRVVIDGVNIRNGACGIYCQNGVHWIRNCVVTGTLSSGITSTGGTDTIVGNMIAGNNYAGLDLKDSRATVVNNTVVSNTYGVSYSYTKTDCPTTLANNIVAFNDMGFYKTLGGTAPTCRSNDVYGNQTDYSGIAPGVYDLSSDPQFASVDYGNLHVQPGSACRNAGWNSAPGLPMTDIDGQARVQDGTVDIGADESDGTTWPYLSRRIYVNASAPEGGDGRSWSTAYQMIGSAFVDVAFGGGADIWVANGTYAGELRVPPFVKLYGGYAGTETESSERAPGAGSTVLDGMGSEAGVTMSNACLIDGFTIENAKVGVRCSGPSPIISANTIRGNSDTGMVLAYSKALVTGNRICNNGRMGISCSNASPRILDNSVTENPTGIWCGTKCAATIAGNRVCGNTECGLSISDCAPTVTRNAINGNGDYGVLCGTNSSPVIAGCTIAGNALYGIMCGGGSAIVTNNSIAGNYIGVHCPSHYYGKVANNIVAFNSMAGIRAAGRTPALSHNDVFGNGTDYLGTQPGDADISADPEFVSYEFGDLHIQPTSPCRNAGVNTAQNLPDMDMDRQPRIQDGTVDIGADESDGTDHWPYTPRVVYVSASAPAGGDGVSWADAYQTLSTAASDVPRNGGAEIWVANGEYREGPSLPSFGHLYGGFAGDESRREDRRLNSGKCVIDLSGIPGGCVSAAEASSIDGFTIKGGQYGLLCDSPLSYGDTSRQISFTASNNILVGNATGVYCRYTSPRLIINNTIFGNSNSGIMLYCSSPTVGNNIVAWNAAGVLSDYKATPVLLHNDVYGNGADYPHGIPGETDISADPLFRGLSTGDFRLSTDSPCIDRGTDDGAPVTDVFGNPRPVDGDCDGLAVTDIGAHEYQPVPVGIDILSGIIRPDKNRPITVAVLAEPGFDLRGIDLATVVFGPGRATEIHRKAHWEDVNGDGLPDLLFHFSSMASGLSAGDTRAYVYGRLVNGERIAGWDDIKVLSR